MRIPAETRSDPLSQTTQSSTLTQPQAWREGYAFRFAPDASDVVTRFVGNERKCCPFLGFEIVVESGGPVWLRMTGPAGTHAFLDAELPRAGFG